MPPHMPSPRRIDGSNTTPSNSRDAVGGHSGGNGNGSGGGGGGKAKKGVKGSMTSKVNSARRLKRSASVSVVDSLFSRGKMDAGDGASAGAWGGDRAGDFGREREQEVFQLLSAGGHVHSGWLWKQGDFTGFKRRFFALEGPHVIYYEKDPAGDISEQRRGVITLRGAVASSIDRPDTGFHHVFKVDLDLLLL